MPPDLRFDGRAAGSLDLQDGRAVVRAGCGSSSSALGGAYASARGIVRRLEGLACGASCHRGHRPSGASGQRQDKTSLLREWVERARKEDGAKTVATLWLTPARIKTEDSLYRRRRLIYADEVEATSERQVTKEARARMSALGVRGAESRTERSEAAPEFLTEALLRRRGKRPLLAVVDEAHTLNPKVGQLLLNTSQEVRGEGLPFQLALAGTPGVATTLGEADSSFWDRGTILGIGLLDREASAEALTVPLDQAGLMIDPGALERVVADSQGYPFFVQLWGAKLVGALEEGETRIGSRHEALAGEAVAAVRTTYYEQRLDELKKERLIEPGRAAARAFAGRDVLSGEELARTLAEALGVPDAPNPAPEVLEVRAGLERLGFFWKPPGRTEYVAGVPSLTRYVLERSAETSPEADGPGT